MTTRVQLIQILTAIDALAMCRPKLSMCVGDIVSGDYRQGALELTLDCWKVLGLHLMAAGVIPQDSLEVRDVQEFGISLWEFLSQGTLAEGEG